MKGFDVAHLEIMHMYLFGDVKHLHFLLMLMLIDILTGLCKAAKNKTLWSRKALFGYTRKLLILIVIITTNIVDQILNLEGVLVFSAVMFYIANEGLSIMENLAELDVLIPPGLAERLLVIESKSTSVSKEIQEELIGTKVNKVVEEVKEEKKEVSNNED